MEGRRVAVRILGVATTTHGFAFAATEGPERLVVLEHRRVPASPKALRAALAAALERTRPLFVACDGTVSSLSHGRRRLLAETLAEMAANGDVLVLWIAPSALGAFTEVSHPTKLDIARSLVHTFSELRAKLPRERRAWKGEDHRIGLFMAVAASVAGWSAIGSHSDDQTQNP